MEKYKKMALRRKIEGLEFADLQKKKILRSNKTKVKYHKGVMVLVLSLIIVVTLSLTLGNQ